MSDLIRAAIAGVDEVAVAIEGKWGVGQLSRKAAAIDPPLAVRFKLQKRKFDDAIAINGKAKTIKHCEAKKHSWQALDRVRGLLAQDPG